ncbi:MAG: GGDEF domain-containing protein, partial [Desulfobulbales bacterium]|nr:GGDEF domain-containing protein [Desulfobulbales bacterium]
GQHLKSPEVPEWLAALEPPLLLVVFTWALFRLAKPFLPYPIILPAMVIAWVTLRYRWSVALPAVLAALMIEVELILTGNQSAAEAAADIMACVIVAASLHLFPGARLYKDKLRGERLAAVRKEVNRQQVAEMGLGAAEIPGPKILPDIDTLDAANAYGEQTVESINKSFELQLEMIRLALNLTSVAVLWVDPAKEDLRLRYLATTRSDIDPGPYPAGAGITGALTGTNEEIELVGVKPSHPRLPYYRKHQDIGAIMLLRIPVGRADREKPETARTGILCVDRESDSPWSDRERRVLRLSARKLGLEISGCRQLLNMDRERAAIHRLCHGLRELNSDPGLDSIFASSIKAVKAQVPTDLLVLCLRQDDGYRVVLAEGRGAEKLLGRNFPLEAGLVGQAIKTARTLPANGRYPETVPVFSGELTLPGNYRSLLIVPLPDEDNIPIGCLAAATESAGVFTGSRREILEIIAAQIAIKVKLGQIHEQLSLLATTDGLTGLANHRAFQHGCGLMLERARRNNTPLCLILGDLDHFKGVNDRFGHPFGDEVLKKAAAVIGDSVRAVDLAARYGGEEFGLALENCDGKGGLIMSERIRERIARLNLFNGADRVLLTISFGIAVFPENCDDQPGLIALADQALYRAKNAGRNRTVVWSGPEDGLTKSR